MSTELRRESNRTPRVALILPSLLPWGGVERLLVSQGRELLNRGYAVDFVFLDEPKDISHALPPAARHFNLGASRLRHSLAPLVRYMRRERPDAVHAALWPLTALVILAHRIARCRARVIVSDHNPLSLQYRGRGWGYGLLMRAIISLTYPLADARVAVSGGVADDIARMTWLGRSQFSVIHNPVPLDLEKDSSAQTAEKLWGPRMAKRILTVGRLKPQKNHALLVRAFKRLSRTIDANLMILGVGELHAELTELIRAEGLSDRIIMPGQVEDPIPFYNSADVFVLSSDYEGFGNVLVEALACGLPVVSTNCPGGPAEILADGRFGRLVPVRNEELLAEAMAAALLNPPERSLLMKRASEFSAPNATQKYLRLMFPDSELADIAHGGSAR